ncbi:MAG: nitrite/sulfite reductase [Polyangiaceae bacterium]
MNRPVTWKDRLASVIREDWAREIDIFETQLRLRSEGRLEEKLFAETRLRRGVYGQRYDNGSRHDGRAMQTLAFPERPSKGPHTVWDAPGMMRIKIPFGKLSADQLEVMAGLADEYSDGILHVTTRQDIQLHFVHIEDTPDLMRRLAAVGITTREACGNSVRNVTACSYAGTCSTQAFDVTPYANALTFFLLGHDDVQDFGRKFKIAFSGCKDEPCGLTNFHDLGLVARTREVDGKQVRGFEFWVGGGLGSVPQSARLLDPFVSEVELLPMSQALCRVFGRLGEKDNRSRARLKFLVKKLGIDELRRLVLEERAALRPDPRWTEYLTDLAAVDETPTLRPAPLEPDASLSEAFRAWRRSNVRAQAQSGYAVATLTLPLGDLSSAQARGVASLARRFTGDTLRATVDQNLLMRWVPEAELPVLYEALVDLGLAEAGAGTLTDVTSCPGTDTCKLGISSSRGLANELRRHLTVLEPEVAGASRDLHVKCSGCFNACGQHHVADIGLLGVSRNVNGRRVPHFQLVVGGQWTENAAAFGLAIGAIPSKNVPAVVERLTRHYAEQRQQGETYRRFVERMGKKQIRALIEELIEVPPYAAAPEFYSDWGDPREYTLDDMGVGECAGEVVPFVQMGLAASEREVFEAQLLLDQGMSRQAAERAYQAMLSAARALTREKNANLGDSPDEIVNEFKTRLVDTRLFWDQFAGPKFSQFLLSLHAGGLSVADRDGAHEVIEEAQLFIDAAHQCVARLGNSLEL